MRCEEFNHRLNELLDRRIAPDDDAMLCSHAHRCPDCADSMAAHLALTAALRNLPSESADETFPFAVMNRLVSEHPEPIATSDSRSLVVRRGWIALLATAASLLIALTLWYGGERSNPSNPGAVDLVDSMEPAVDYDLLAEQTQELAALITTRRIEVMNDLVEGIRPVASSFGAAFEALRRTLPGSRSEPNAASS